MRVAEVARGRGYDGVVLIFGEGLAAVGAVGHALCLAWACRSIESHYGAVAIACRIVFIKDTRPAEDGAQSVAEESQRLMVPINEVGTCGMSP